MSEKQRLRTKKFSIYLFEEEYEYLRKGAFEYDLSLSDYIRQLIVAGEIRGRHWTMDKEEGKQIINELNRIGNSLNIIANNSIDRRIGLPEDWKAVQTTYFELLCILGKLPFLNEDTRELWANQAAELLLNHMQTLEIMHEV